MRGSVKNFRLVITAAVGLFNFSCEQHIDPFIDPFEAPAVGQKITLAPLPLTDTSDDTKLVTALVISPPGRVTESTNKSGSIKTVSFRTFDGKELVLEWSKLASSQKNDECPDEDSDVKGMLENYPQMASVCDSQVISQLQKSALATFTFDDGRIIQFTSWGRISPQLFYGRILIYAF
jgi:hypothetical protein